MTVAIIPIVGITVLVLYLNIVAPSSTDVRVIKYVVQVIPQVKGRVIDVPAEGNRPMKKGDVLFRIDPTPYELDVKALEAQLAGSEGSARELREQLNVAKGNTAALRSQIDLTKLRVKQYQELSATGAGNRFDLEKAQADLANLQGQVASAIANEARAQAQLAAVVDGDLASVATIKANLAKARWDLTPDGDVRTRQRLGHQCAVAARVVRQPHAACPGDELRRGRVPGDRALPAERAVAGRARQRGGNRARHVPRRHHQGDRGLDRLGPGPGPARHVGQPAEHRADAPSRPAASP